MSTSPTQPDPNEAITSLLSSVKVCSDATTGAVVASMQAAFDEKNMQRAGEMAATAQSAAAAARDLTAALAQMRATFPPAP